MRYGTRVLFFCLLIVQVQTVLGQEGDKAGQAAPPAATTEISADTPVITMDGLCANELITADVATLLNPTPATAAAPKYLDAGCKTVITRGQYEQLLTAIGGKPRSGGSPNFAHQLTDMVLFSEKARGTEGSHGPSVQEKLRYAYLQTFAQLTMVQMQREANDVTDADTAQYFKEHSDRFVRMHLQQISVPKHRAHDDQAAPVKPNPAEQEEMHQLALKIQKEAAAGGNIEKLEARAYKAANDDSVPEIDLGEPVPEEVPTEFRKLIFDLQPGQVSTVVENDHEYLIYKCVSRRMVPEAERKKLYGWLRMRDAKQALQDQVHTQYNPQYFAIPPGEH